MRAEFQLTVPDSALATLTINAEVGTLKRLAEQLGECEQSWNWPMSNLQYAIRDAISQAEETILSKDNPNSQP